jgi:acyl carrier protein
MKTVLEILKDYIKDELGFLGEIDPEEDLLDAKILDSFSIVQIAMFIQDHFGFELEAEEVVRSNLGSLSSMVELINKREIKGIQEI